MVLGRHIRFLQSLSSNEQSVNVAWSMAWILPQAHKAQPSQSGHRNCPNTSCIRNPKSRLYKVTCIYICALWYVVRRRELMIEIIPNNLAAA